MKKIYLLGAMVAALTAGAQQIPRVADNMYSFQKETLRAARTQAQNPNVSPNAVITAYIDYSALDFNDLSYVWRFNSNYTSVDTSFNYVGVAIKDFQWFTDYNDVSGTWAGYGTYPAGFSYTIDSVWALITHENNSGTYNKIQMEIVPLTVGNAMPATTTTPLWFQLDSTNVSLSSGGEWLGSGALAVLEYAPNYTTPAGQKVGLCLKYMDPTKTDTFSVLGSCVDDGSGGTMQQAQYSTSYMRYPPFIPNITTNNTVGYGSPVGSQGWLEAQDWEISAKVTFTDVTGVHDAVSGNSTLYQNIPNPANGTTMIKYDLKKSADVTFVITDITGKTVKVISEGSRPAGNYQLMLNTEEFSKGTYFYTLRTNEGVSITKKMTITN